MTTDRRQFTDEFKREAVRLAQERGSLAEVARELGLHDTVLQRWKKALAQTPQNPFPGHGNPADPEADALRRENARLREENEILKKGSYIFGAPSISSRTGSRRCGCVRYITALPKPRSVRAQKRTTLFYDRLTDCL